MDNAKTSRTDFTYAADKLLAKPKSYFEQQIGELESLRYTLGKRSLLKDGGLAPPPYLTREEVETNMRIDRCIAFMRQQVVRTEAEKERGSMDKHRDNHSR